MKKLIIIIALILVMIPIVEAQEYDDGFFYNGWRMDNSDRIISIGETYWINITGSPSHSFKLIFTPVLFNSTVEEWTYHGFTNTTGNQSVEYDIDDTRIPGLYRIGLVVNDSIYQVVELDIRDSEYMRGVIKDRDQDLADAERDEIINDLRYDIGKLIKLVDLLYYTVIFLLCYFIVRNGVDLWLHGPEYFNRWVKWSHQQRLYGKIRDANPPNPNEDHFKDYGGRDIKSPGDSARNPDDLDPDCKSMIGLDHDDSLDHLLNEAERGTDFPERPDIPKPKEWHWRDLYRPDPEKKLLKQSKKIHTKAEKLASKEKKEFMKKLDSAYKDSKISKMNYEKNIIKYEKEKKVKI